MRHERFCPVACLLCTVDDSRALCGAFVSWKLFHVRINSRAALGIVLLGCRPSRWPIQSSTEWSNADEEQIWGRRLRVTARSRILYADYEESSPLVVHISELQDHCAK